MSPAEIRWMADYSGPGALPERRILMISGADDPRVEYVVVRGRAIGARRSCLLRTFAGWARKCLTPPESKP